MINSLNKIQLCELNETELWQINGGGPNGYKEGILVGVISSFIFVTCGLDIAASKIREAVINNFDEFVAAYHGNNIEGLSKLAKRGCDY